MSEPKRNDGTEPKSGASRIRSVRAGVTVGYVNADTLADVVLDRTSNPVKAWQILSYVALFGVFVETQGREPRSIREMAEIFDKSHATLNRWARSFKTAFPEYDTPAVLWVRVREQLNARAVEEVDSVAFRVGAAVLT